MSPPPSCADVAADSVARFAAADLGAGSGRVVLGEVSEGTLRIRDAHRFDNRPVMLAGTLHWDIAALYLGVLDGVRAASRTATEQGGTLDGIGVDSWAVDYGLVDGQGALLGLPVSYRDSRTDGIDALVHGTVAPAELYARTGLQHQPFNTVFQLLSEVGTARLAGARHLLLLPDLVGFWLTGAIGAEMTNASTTQMLDASTRTWATDLVDTLGLDPGLLPPLRRPGDVLGPVLPRVAEDLGLAPGTPVVAVGSHDTASAVVAVPAASPSFAYISCGTWSLVGVELPAPVLTEASRTANFTNELGVDDTVRYLRNVMGLWLLSQSLEAWQRAGSQVTLAGVLAQAREVPRFQRLVDPDRPVFLPPGDMPARIAAECRRTGQGEPTTAAETVRCILDSLAVAYRRAVRQASELSGHRVDVVHLVGGGARNELLCQLTADACGLPVVAGPVEASALGNLLVQARAVGRLTGGLPDLRALVRSTHTLVRYEPSPGPASSGAAWDEAERRAFGA